MTKDESYILTLYKAAGRGLKDRYEIGKLIGLGERPVNAIVKTLEQTNFVRRVGERQIVLTANGVTLALSLLSLEERK